MGLPSSTSNSEEPFPVGKVPWALALAFLALLLLELGVRRIDPRDAIPYDLAVRTEYGALRHHLRAEGPPDVAVIGSSRGREDFSMPLMRDLVQEALGRPVRIGNFSAAGASAATCRNVVGLLLREREAPGVILYGVSMMQLAAAEVRNDHAPLLWYLDDWLRGGVMAGELRASLEILPEVLRNQLGAVYRTFAYRERLPQWIREVAGAGERPPCPIVGELTIRQHLEPERSLVSRPVSRERVRQYLARRMREGRYPLGEGQGRHLRELAALARRRGVDLRMVELPVAPILHEQLPDGTYQEFLARLRRIAEVEDVPLVTLGDLGLGFGDEQFREQSHLNLAGAERLTRVVSERIVIPALQARERREAFGSRRHHADVPQPAPGSEGSLRRCSST